MVNFTFNPLATSMALLKEWGFFEVLLPMLLVFLIVYAILLKTEILGDSDKVKAVKAINMLIAIIIGFVFVTQTELVAVLNNVIPRVSLLMIMTLFVLMLFAFIGVYKSDESWLSEWKKKTWWIVIPLGLIFLGILDASGVYIPGVHGIMVNLFGGPMGTISFDQETINNAIAILLFVGIPIAVLMTITKTTGKIKDKL